MASTKDPKDFGPTPARAKGFKLPEPLPNQRPALLALVAASGMFPPRAARWLAPREIRALLTADFPLESSTILTVTTPRQIKTVDDLLTLAADRRVSYTAELKERAAEKTNAAKLEATPKKQAEPAATARHAPKPPKKDAPAK
jgi:hypothetical protein